MPDYPMTSRTRVQAVFASLRESTVHASEIKLAPAMNPRPCPAWRKGRALERRDTVEYLYATKIAPRMFSLARCNASPTTLRPWSRFSPPLG
jgi:hypothetical protein